MLIHEIDVQKLATEHNLPVPKDELIDVCTAVELEDLDADITARTIGYFGIIAGTWRVPFEPVEMDEVVLLPADRALQLYNMHHDDYFYASHTLPHGIWQDGHLLITYGAFTGNGAFIEEGKRRLELAKDAYRRWQLRLESIYREYVVPNLDTYRQARHIGERYWWSCVSHLLGLDTFGIKEQIEEKERMKIKE